MLSYNQKYITADTETEGLNHFFSRPWSIALVASVGSRVVEKKEIFVDVPDLDLSPKLRKMCNFNPVKYKKEKVPPLEAWEEVKKYFLNPEYKIVGQNFINYDTYIIGILQRMAGVKRSNYSFLPRIIDTLALGKAYKEKLEKPNSDFFGWQLKVLNDRSLRKRANQKQLLKEFKIPFVEERLHESQYDSEKCFELFLALKKYHKL